MPAHKNSCSCKMTVPEVTEDKIESPPVLIENQESYYDSNDQSILEHLESNYDRTVHSFYDEEVGVVTAENFFNSAKSVILGTFFSLMFDFSYHKSPKKRTSN